MAEELKGYLEVLPEVQKSLIEMTTAELLVHGGRQSLLRMIGIIERPPDPENLKFERLAGDMANSMIKHLVHIRQTELQGQRTDALTKILEAITRASEKKITDNNER